MTAYFLISTEYLAIIYCDMQICCSAMTTIKGTIQQPLLSNGSRNKHVSTSRRGYNNNWKRCFYAVRAEI
jgi:hypothetical protein